MRDLAARSLRASRFRPSAIALLHRRTAEALVKARPYRKPAAYLVAETRRPVPFDVEAFRPGELCCNSVACRHRVDRPKNAEPGDSPARRIVQIGSERGWLAQRK